MEEDLYRNIRRDSKSLRGQKRLVGNGDVWKQIPEEGMSCVGCYPLKKKED
jgi:hypothetical protein